MFADFVVPVISLVVTSPLFIVLASYSLRYRIIKHNVQEGQLRAFLKELHPLLYGIFENETTYIHPAERSIEDLIIARKVISGITGGLELALAIGLFSQHEATGMGAYLLLMLAMFGLWLAAWGFGRRLI